VDVRLIQTSDAVRYKPLLDITSRACSRLCEIQGLCYSQFVGLKLGTRPWHAIFNRIQLLADIAATEYTGWAIYLDADAYPFDLTFDLKSYLSRNQHYALIGTQCQADQRLPNSGILLINFADLRSREIVFAWQRFLNVIYPGGALPPSSEWPEDVHNDQSMLHCVLEQRGDVEQAVRFESPRLIGDMDAIFLRQVLRRFGDFDWLREEATTGVAVALMMAEAWKK
jgi:hypothetical protein